jgi:hypothetical protein
VNGDRAEAARWFGNRKTFALRPRGCLGAENRLRRNGLPGRNLPRHGRLAEWWFFQILLQLFFAGFFGNSPQVADSKSFPAGKIFRGSPRKSPNLLAIVDAVLSSQEVETNGCPHRCETVKVETKNLKMKKLNMKKTQ